MSLEREPDASAAAAENVEPGAPLPRWRAGIRWWGVLLMLLALAALAWAAWTYVVQPRVFGHPLPGVTAAAGTPELRIAPPLWENRKSLANM